MTFFSLEVDTAEAEQLIRQGLGRRNVKPDSGCLNGNSSSSDSQVVADGIHGYEQITQSVFSQRLKKFVHTTFLPLFLVMSVPQLIILIWYTVVHCDGSYLKMLAVFSDKNVFAGLAEVWSHVNRPSSTVITVFIVYCVYALLMMKVLPGATIRGPQTPKGNTPVYKDNGFSYFLLTLGLFWSLVILQPFGISPSIFYDKMDELLFTFTLFGFSFCAFLYLKGRFFPSSSDSGLSGNVIFDYYWGTELYPRVCGFDVKLFTNCRFGMMVWALQVCVYAVKSYELHGFVDSMFVSATLQLLYIGKFFWWESGYLSTMDIMHDRAGFYICFGCLVYVPGIYPTAVFYLVSHPVQLGLAVSGIFLLLGALCICINFAADDQKQKVRRTGGNCLIWGRKPDVIHAKYQLENGDIKENILLASGWWGLSRHFHYIPETMLALTCAVPAMFDNLLPYTYFIHLLILLTHRSYRDDSKCEQKYGSFWSEYCKRVPYRIIPYLF